MPNSSTTKSIALAFVAALTSAVATESFADTSPVPSTAESEVLTLEQGADFLKLSVNQLRGLLESGKVPGRKIADEWRMTRTGLLLWLGAPVVPGPIPGQTSASEAPGAPGTRPSSSTAQEDKRAVDDLLRDRAVLNKAGELSVEVGLQRGSAERYGTDPATGDTVRAESRATALTTTLRYGIDDRSQLSFTTSGSRQTVDVEGQRMASAGWQREASLLRYSRLIRSADSISAVGIVGSIAVELPGEDTHDHSGVGMTLAFALPMDPAVLTWDIGYLHRFNRSEQFIPKSELTSTLGIAFGLNDQVSLGARLSAAYTDDGHRRDDQYRATLHAGLRISKRLYVEPSFGISLSGSGDARVGVVANYTFGL